MRSFKSLLAVALVPLFAFAVGACAGGGPGGGSSNLITDEQIASSGAGTAFEAVQQLRSRWLQTRGPTSIQNPDPPTPVVYVDGQRLGGVGSLHQISAQHVAEMRFINARDATTRYGTGHTGGVIRVSTQR